MGPVSVAPIAPIVIVVGGDSWLAALADTGSVAIVLFDREVERSLHHHGKRTDCRRGDQGAAPRGRDGGCQQVGKQKPTGSRKYADNNNSLHRNKAHISLLPVRKACGLGCPLDGYWKG